MNMFEMLSNCGWPLPPEAQAGDKGAARETMPLGRDTGRNRRIKQQFPGSQRESAASSARLEIGRVMVWNELSWGYVINWLTQVLARLWVGGELELGLSRLREAHKTDLWLFRRQLRQIKRSNKPNSIKSINREGACSLCTLQFGAAAVSTLPTKTGNSTEERKRKRPMGVPSPPSGGLAAATKGNSLTSGGQLNWLDLWTTAERRWNNSITTSGGQQPLKRYSV